jgi:hypothetical protein
MDADLTTDAADMAFSRGVQAAVAERAMLVARKWRRFMGGVRRRNADDAEKGDDR